MRKIIKRIVITILFSVFARFIIKLHWNAVKLKPPSDEHFHSHFTLDELAQLIKGASFKFEGNEKTRELEVFSAALKLQTDDRENYPGPFKELWKLVRDNYPLFFQMQISKSEILRTLEISGENEDIFARLFIWEGSSNNEDLDPLLFAGHVDVVSVADPSEWLENFGPYSGSIKDGERIYGRGTVDDKITVFNIIQATEKLLREGYQPKRTIIFAFGEDEEQGGMKGARRITDYFLAKKITPAFGIDEASCLVERSIPGVDVPVAFIGVNEKVSMRVNISLNCEEGGHIAMPVTGGCVEQFSSMISTLLDKDIPSKIREEDTVFRLIVKHVFSTMPYLKRLIFANLNTFAWLVEYIFKQKTMGPTNALIRSTVAPTIVRMGDVSTALPTNGFVYLWVYMLPPDTKEDVVKHFETILKDFDISIDVMQLKNVQKDACVECKQFSILREAIKTTWDDIEVLVTPYILVAGSDMSWYKEVVTNGYNIMPFILDKTELSLFHGVNENISLENFYRSIKFYYSLIKMMEIL